MNCILKTMAMALGVTSCASPSDQYPVQEFQTPVGKTVRFFMVNHGSLAMEYDGMWMHIDPVSNFYGRKIDYKAFPKADVLLYTHAHEDHFDAQLIPTLAKDDAQIVLTREVQSCLDRQGVVLKNGDDTLLQGKYPVKALPAYNTTPGRDVFHPRGRDNGYLFNLDGFKVYISADTEPIPEMEALRSEEIDVVFMAVNQPYTMTPEQCIQAALTVRPKVLIPYHLGDTDLNDISAGFVQSNIKVLLFESLR